MRVLLNGFGAMGKLIKEELPARSHECVGWIDPGAAGSLAKKLDPKLLKNVDVVIDYSRAHGVLSTLETCLAEKVPLLIGTTGWKEHEDKVRSDTASKGGRVLAAANTLLGVNLFFEIVSEAARLMSKIDDCDVWGFELHHHNKADSPSGTARVIAQRILEEFPRKKTVQYDKLDRKPEPSELHFASVRGGAVNFEHRIGFDTPHEQVVVSHAARSRAGYAAGAVKAAEWLVKQPPGYYTERDFFKSVLSR